MTQVYSRTTRKLKVTVIPEFRESLSSISQHLYVWTYNIMLENYSENVVQLISRSWQVIDAKGLIHEISGTGVVGKQPILKPGGVFKYKSQTKLSASSGIMLGSYKIEDKDSGELYDVVVPAFSLDNPYDLIILN